MPDTESDLLHRGDDAAVARLDLVEPDHDDAATATSSSCATATAHDEDDGFTFASPAVAVPVMQDAADCASPDAQISSPVYPVFGRPRWSLPNNQQQQQQQQEQQEDPAATTSAAGTATTVRVPLGRLLFEDRCAGRAPSSASEQHQQPAADANADAEAELDELDGVPAETYCIWYPGVSLSPGRASSPAARCRKSGSTGSSILLRWRRRRRRSRSVGVGVGVGVERSHSVDGKDKFAFLSGAATCSDRGAGEGEGHGWMNRVNHGSPVTGGGGGKSSSLPCKQDLVGFFASAVTFRRSYLPF